MKRELVINSLPLECINSANYLTHPWGIEGKQVVDIFFHGALPENGSRPSARGVEFHFKVPGFGMHVTRTCVG